jgi:inosine/xanthosine triphosphate pyrophosphatase family protein
MKNIKNRKCHFTDCLTFYDGIEYYTFYGISSGNLSYEKRGNPIKKAKSNLWLVFIPDNYEKTLAELSDEERHNRKDGHTDSVAIFIDWYQNIYLKKKRRKYEKNNSRY